MTTVIRFISGNSVAKESQPSIYMCKLGISRQAVEIIWTAHHVFDGIQSFWQPAFVLAYEWKGSREASRLTVLSWLVFGEKLTFRFCPVWAKDLVRILSGMLLRKKKKSGKMGISYKAMPCTA